MNNIITIMKKELARFFTDRKLVFSTLLLPGLMIYVMYSFMGSAFAPKDDENYKYKVAMASVPSSLSAIIEDMPIENVYEASKDNQAYLTMIENKEIDAYVVFEDNFDEAVNDQNVPNVEVFYNSTREESRTVYSMFEGVLNTYENSISNVFDLNSKDGTIYNLASDKEMTGMMFSSILPMLLMIFIFSGCMGVAPDSIAGEKERGTIATLLVTPIKRSELAIGKIVSLSIISLLAGLSSFIGTLLSMPKLMGTESMGLDASAYTYADYGMLLVVILSTVLIFISLLSVISSFAKSVKEAGSYVMPVMLISMFIGISSMMMTTAPNLVTACIPLYNNVALMSQILQFNVDMTYFVITIVVNLVFTGVLVFALTKIFNNEKIMFNA